MASIEVFKCCWLQCQRPTKKALAHLEPARAASTDEIELSDAVAAARRGVDGCVRACRTAGARVDRANGTFGTALYAAVCAGAPSTPFDARAPRSYSASSARRSAFLT